MAVLGIHTFAIAPEWQTETMRDNCPLLKAHRVKILEIPLLRPDRFDVEGAKSFARQHDFQLVTSLGLPGTIDLVSDMESGLAFLANAFRVTQALGGDVLSGVTYGTIGKTTGRPVTQRERDTLCRFLEAACRKADGFGLRLGIEPCNRYETHLMNTAADAVGYVEAVGAPNLFIHLDTYHMHIEEQDFASGFATAAPYLGYVHLSESNRGTPGRGMVNWPAAMAALTAIGYDGILTLESMNHVDPDIAGGLAIWRPVAQNPDDVLNLGIPFLRRVASAAGLSIE